MNIVGGFMKKITIGLFNDSFPPMTDGVGMVVDNYARRLSKYCDVVVCVPRYKKKFYDSTLPYKIIRCRSMKVPFLDYSLPLPMFDFKFRREVKKYSFDLVHIHSPFTLGKYGIKIAKRRNIPVIATMHSQFKQDFLRAVHFDFFATFLNRILMKVFDQCTQCFAVNSGMATLFYEDYGVKELPRVLSNATEFEYVENKEESFHKINQLHHLLPNDKVFLFVGRINQLKNIFFIVDSLVLLNQKELSFSYKMLFVGDGGDMASLKEYIHKKNMDDFIILCGNVSDRQLLKDYYVRSDLFLFPSLYDASSIVQIEAASQKVPTVFLKGSKTSSDIIDRENGFLADDCDSFAEIIDLAMRDDQLYQKVSEGCYRDVYKNWDTTIKDVYEII